MSPLLRDASCRPRHSVDHKVKALITSETIDEFRMSVEQLMVAFEARFGMKPTALVMCPSDAEIWVAAQKRGLFLFEELEISVNPLADVSGLRRDLAVSRPAKYALH
jgi:hypothetical protein